MDPGEFDQTEPEAPTPADRMDYAEKLEELEEKTVAVIEFPDPDVDEPFEFDDPPAPNNDEEIFDEEVPLSDLPEIEDEAPVEQPEEPLEDLFDEETPLADVPATGDTSPMFAAMCALSTFALSAMQFLSRRKRNEK